MNNVKPKFNSYIKCFGNEIYTSKNQKKSATKVAWTMVVYMYTQIQSVLIYTRKLFVKTTYDSEESFA